METAALIVVLVILLALFFDFTNGFHDTANAMATPIATGALKPKTAVLLAAVLNLVGAFLSTEVSKTVSHGIIREDTIQGDVFLPMIFAGLIGAITWNMLTWLLGLPSSSSHALFGGLIGATLVGVGVNGIDFGMVLSKIILPALIAPLTAGIIAFAATKLAYSITRRYDGKPDGRDGFRWGQIFTSSLVALAHGTNDAQKTMGVITLALITVGWQSSEQADPYLWVIIACAVTIALGTYLGGWRIIRTLGKGLTEVKPAQGFSAESSTAATILASSAFGFALSTTQVASGSVIGSGLGRRGSTVRWRTAGRIAIGWLLTLPAAGAVGALAALLITWLGLWGIAIDAVLALAVIIGLFLRSRKDAVTSANAMSDVAESGLAIEHPDTPPPTRRQQRIIEAKAEAKARAEAREKVKAQAKADAKAKAAAKAAKKAPKTGASTRVDGPGVDSPETAKSEESK
ncbi:phosphate transporter [Microbacterium sp. 1.5R]|uniref:inorganic phosphate transporter n=1 Tax=unclassified Microbacterium TaxID=2609290 RepID=UPI00069D1B47|nr:MULTISPECIES: inorganic phosphate transporter [unclassified Microbacterium]AKV85329.1 phosphate transporter [Microbacterium sp. CGR1]APH44728.1 phosphate transporter [Microbacterium sp. 1.5R]KRD51877.1 phosphate transporter [Microbacterium sp. Root280D1]CAH0157096.1 Low-affinity inorganic phosphate transporter 1 [Microbacterium sp. Bi98]